jgi:general secretion pathway protein D
MRHRWLKKISKKNCVPGSQGSPQEPAADCVGALTPGSCMNHRARPSACSGSVACRAVSAFASLAILAALSLSSAPLHAAGPSAGSLFKHGQDAEARHDYDTAFEDYQKAFQKNPKDLRFQSALYRVRGTASSMHITNGRKLLQSGDIQGALGDFLHAAEIDPGNEEAQQEIDRVRERQAQTAPTPEIAVPELAGQQAELDSIGAPAQLKLTSTEPLTLHMTEDSKVVYQAIGKAAGINVLFDPDFTAKRVQVDLNNVYMLDALRIVGTMTNTFWRPITSNTIFVAANTRSKRTELDEQAVQTFYLANAWQQNDLNDVQTALRNVMPNTKVYGVQSQNAIVMRGTPDELLLAQKLIGDLDKPRPEVVVDMAVLEVSKNWERTVGISWPSSFGISLSPPSTSSSTSSSSCTAGTTGCTSTSSGTSPTLYSLSHLKASDFKVTVGSATLNLLLTDTNTQILQDPRVRATDGQKAAMKIGSKIPIATGSYQTGAATALVSSLVNTQFQYEDVGVDIEMTPSVHYNHDVTLKIKITVSAQSGSVSISGVTEPILSQRVVDQVIRLREGEASILGGIQDNQTTQSWTGVPGLSSIPILKYLFGSKDKTIQDDEIVFVVVPHVVRSQDLDRDNLRAIDTGSGQSIDLRRVEDDEPPSAAAPAVRPAAFEKPSLDTIPSSSAQAAAPMALAQMRADQRPDFSPPPAAAPTAAPPPASVQPAPQPSAQMAPPAVAQPAAQPIPPPGAQLGTLPGAQIAPPSAPPSAPQPGLPRTDGGAFTFTAPSAPVAAGATFQVPVVLNGGADVASVPLQLHYDPAKLTLINVSAGALLSSDGQAVAVIHRDDGPGNVNVVASRPPGAAGVTGTGVVCVLTFQAKASGPSILSITHAAVVNSAQKQLPAVAGQASILVR